MNIYFTREQLEKIWGLLDTHCLVYEEQEHAYDKTADILVEYLGEILKENR